jgi:hypothetical protein
MKLTYVFSLCLLLALAQQQPINSWPYYSPFYDPYPRYYYRPGYYDNSAAFVGTAGLLAGVALASQYKDPRTQTEIEQDERRAEEIRQKREEMRQERLDNKLKREEARAEKRRKLDEQKRLAQEERAADKRKQREEQAEESAAKRRKKIK